MGFTPDDFDRSRVANVRYDTSSKTVSWDEISATVNKEAGHTPAGRAGKIRACIRSVRASSGETASVAIYGPGEVEIDIEDPGNGKPALILSTSEARELAARLTEG